MRPKFQIAFSCGGVLTQTVDARIERMLFVGGTLNWRILVKLGTCVNLLGYLHLDCVDPDLSTTV
jgi:hypothetical protein